MPDVTFETLVAGQLRTYAEGGVRPIDRFAIAEEAIERGRTVPRWRLAPMAGGRLRTAVLVGLVLAALGGGALVVGTRLLAPPRHTYLGEIVAAADLPTAVAAPALVPLPDGTVVVVDASGGGQRTTAWIYDPDAGTSVDAGPLVPAGATVGSAILLRDGRVLLVSDAGAWIFDPTSGRSLAVGPSVTPRSGGFAALLLDGRVLIAGGLPPNGEPGVDPALRSAEVFDPGTLTYWPTGGIATPTGGGPLVTLPDGRVFMAASDAAEIYDPATGTFSAASTTTSGGGGDPVVLPDGRVLLAGSTGLYDGGRIQVWEPTSQRFSRHDVVEPLTDATLLDDGRIFLLGMCRGRPAGWTGVYDPASEVLTPTPGTRACRPESTRLADGRVLIVGGVEPALPTVEIFR